MPSAATTSPTTPRAFLSGALSAPVALTAPEVFDRNSLARELERAGLVRLVAAREGYRARLTGEGVAMLVLLNNLHCRLGWAEAPRGAGE